MRNKSCHRSQSPPSPSSVWTSAHVHTGGGVAIVTPLAIRATGHRSHVAAKPQTAVRSTPPTAVRHTQAQSRSVKVDQAAPTTAHEGASARQHTPDCCESHEAELRQPQPAKEPATGSALPAAVHRNKRTDAVGNRRVQRTADPPSCVIQRQPQPTRVKVVPSSRTLGTHPAPHSRDTPHSDVATRAGWQT